MRPNLKILIQGIAPLVMFLFLAGCAKDELVTPQNQSVDERGSTTTGPPRSTLIYALSDNNDIVKLMSGPPATEVSRVSVSGLRPGDFLVAIDIRPSTKQIYGVTSSSLLYIIDPNFGIAQPVSLIPFSPAINGTLVGLDFDPLTDRIRLVTEKGQNIRINPSTGLVTNVDFPINPANAAVNSIAYSYGTAGLITSSLYAIGLTEGKLYRQNPIGGSLTPVGSLGLLISGEGGFDISRTNNAFAILYSAERGGIFGSIDNSSPAFRLYWINLRTGQTVNMGKVRNLLGLAIP